MLKTAPVKPIDGPSRPRVSVIVPTYNSSATLRCALQSIANQTYSDFEVLVVGDGCTDDSADVVASLGDARFTWFNLDRNHGSQSWPNNEGLRRAKGAYIAFLGHDDLWFPWHLSSLVETMEHSNADFAHGVIVDVWPAGCAELHGSPYRKNSYDQHFVPPSGWMHRHDIVETIRFWPNPDSVLLGVDFDWQRRAFRAGLRFASTGTLSVVKFRSEKWGLLAARSKSPQPSYLQLIEQTPERLRDWLLQEVAFRQSARDTSWKESLRSLLRLTVNAIGRERWPLRPLYSWYWRRARRRKRMLRGMPHADGTMTLPSRSSKATVAAP